MKRKLGLELDEGTRRSVGKEASSLESCSGKGQLWIDMSRWTTFIYGPSRETDALTAATLLGMATGMWSNVKHPR
jgi:hypothetical protein